MSQAKIRFDYDVRRSRRVRSRITVRVYPDASVVVSAPLWADNAQINAVVAQYAGWVHDRLRRIEAAGPVYRLCYDDGAEHDFLGRRYRLRLMPVPGRSPAVRVDLRGDQLQVRGAQLTPTAIERGLRRWYRAQAQDVLSASMASYAERLPWVDRLPPLAIRRMRSQWGSCSSRGQISLNTHLVKAAPSLIDYVVLHELCHLVHANHGPGFRRLMSAWMADWEARRRVLNESSPRLLQG